MNGTQPATTLAFREAMGGILGEGPRVEFIDVSEVFCIRGWDYGDLDAAYNIIQYG